MTTLATYVNELRELSSLDLTHSIQNLADEERRRTAQLIAHLAEISGRKLHLELGLKSLHEYCVERLGLSDGCAWLRIQVSRVCFRFPLLLDELWGGRVSLTVAGKLARAAEVAGVLNAHRNLAEVIEKALDVFLEKKDPPRRQQRREKRQARKAEKATVGTPRLDEAVNESSSPEPDKRSPTSRSLSVTVC